MTWTLYSIILFSSFFSGLALANDRVEFRTSKMHGLYTFALAVSGDTHRSPTVQKLFKESAYAKKFIPEVTALKKLMESMDPGYNYHGFPESRKSGQNVYSLYFVQSVLAKNMSDFSERTRGLLPISEHRELFGIFKKLLPVYEELIWNKSSPSLSRYSRNLDSISAKTDLNFMFDTAAKFYHSDWPVDIPFTAALNPLPGTKGSRSESNGSVESLGVLLKEKDMPGVFGVLFHELCHSLYDAQSSEFQAQFESYFLKQDSKYASAAHKWINEALATALGNGWAYEKVTGTLDQSNWYNSKYVNDYAKALYPNVKAYLEKKKSMDQDFARQAISTFEKTFPDAIYEYEGIFSIVSVLAVEEVRIVIRDLIKERFKTWEVLANSIDDPVSVSHSAQSRDTLLVIIPKGKERLFDTIGEQVPFLSQSVSEIKKETGDIIYSSVDQRGRALIVIYADAKNLTAGIDLIQKAGKIDPKNPLTRF